MAEAATPEDAVRRALTGTITATVGSQSARYAFGPGTVGLSKHDHLPYLVQVSGTTGRVWLEDLAGFAKSDWDYDDRSWRVTVRPLNATSSSGGGTFSIQSYPQPVATAESMWYGAMVEGTPDQIRLRETVTQVSDTEYKWDLEFTNTSWDNSNPDSFYNQGVQALELAVLDTGEISKHVTPVGWSADETVTIGGGPLMRWETDSDYIMPGKSRTFSFFTPPRPFTWYPGGGYSPPNGIGEVEVSVEGAGMVPDKPPKADIDIMVGASEMDETEEDNPGALVVKRAYANKAPREQVVVQSIPGFTDGEVWVTWDGNVKLYPTNGNEAPPLAPPYQLDTDGYYKIATNALPFTMYVEGSIESDSAKDTKITAIPAKGGVMGTPDSVTFTVLWIDVELRFEGQISPMAMNDKADLYENYRGTTDLGLLEWTYWDDAGFPRIAYGIGFEAKGYVSPADIDLAEFGASVLLDRDVEDRDYNGTTIWNQTDHKPEDQIPRGNDRSSVMLDSNPADSTPRGLIFDLDAPNDSFFYSTYVWPEYPGPDRRRFNFKQFGVATLPGHADEVRASKIANGWLRYSFTVEPDLSNPGYFTLVPNNDIPGDNTAGLGTTPITWNLQ